jgi:LuxR family maltose regulon positive regulatory protein
MVMRPRLTEWLNERQGRPLTLVSAPAGYGKSTLISCWLEQADCPTAWVSLDERDNDLVSFLSYFLAAIVKVFPDAVPESQALLAATSLPPVSPIANILINELNRIEEQFILVLDDYQVIEDHSIHQLLNELLLHPPRNLHLVMGTRMDPPLSLVTLRAKGMLTEVRIPSLRFNPEETRLLFQQMFAIPVDQDTLIEIESQAEGWVTGLRLAALAMRHRVAQDSLPGELSANNRYVTEYLVNEILEKQAATLSDCMLKTSILNRLCTSLCEAVCSRGGGVSGNGSSHPDSAVSDLSGAQFLEWLQDSNLFVIPLDDQREWFRYHHLFRDFLQQELARRLGPDEIGKLHAAAGRWFAANGWIEEGLSHLLAAGEISAAIELVAQYRYRMLNNTQWLRLDRWLSLFSQEMIESSAELWMLKTWLAYHRGQWAELPALLRHLATITEGEANKGIADKLAGEISTLYSLLAYHNGDAERVISQARKALDLIDPEFWIVRVLARVYLSGGLQMTGDDKGSYSALYEAFVEEQVQSRRFKATLLLTACSIHWVSADLGSMARAAKQSIALCQEIDFREIFEFGNSQLGRVHYQWNNLSAAEDLFAGVVSRPYQNYGESYTNSVCGLALTRQALGKETQALETIDEAFGFLLETGNTTQLPLVQASQAEVALMQGRLAVASQWAAKLDPVPPLVPMPWFLAPHLTLVKVWLAQNTPASQNQARKLLSQLEEYLEGIHNTRFLIETLALQALLDDVTGDQPAAQAALEKALRLAQPGGFIRLFVDLGPGMARLLAQLKVDNGLHTYVEQILPAFRGSQRAAPSIAQGELLEPLTNRELQILKLLEERLTNKEIAVQLVITPGTVKGHTSHIYQKLDVKGRRQAVEKARALGILSPK